MESITAKQLHQETKNILDQLENGERLLITRNGQPIGRLEPLPKNQEAKWDDLMEEVWTALSHIEKHEKQLNPVLVERQRRRR